MPNSSVASTARSGWMFRDVIIIAQHTDDAPISEPTEISMPPVMITIVMPTATMPFTATWRRMFKKVEAEKKPSATMEKNRTMPTSTR